MIYVGLSADFSEKPEVYLELGGVLSILRYSLSK
jgi:hypothetical protein